MIQAIILAAGESRRMGMPKPLLRFGPTTFLGQIASVLRQSRVDRVSVVLGAEAERIRRSIDLPEVDVVINEDYAEGQLSSLIAGLKALPSQTEAAVVCLVDNPFISPAIVNQIVDRFRQTHSPIVVPVVMGKRGHPALFSSRLFADLLRALHKKAHVTCSARTRGSSARWTPWTRQSSSTSSRLMTTGRTLEPIPCRQGRSSRRSRDRAEGCPPDRPGDCPAAGS